MAKGSTKNRSGGEFDKQLAHAMVDRAVSQLQEAKIMIGKEERNWLYRMGMIGVMAAFAARGEFAPRAVKNTVVTGKPLSKKRWQAILGD